MAIETLNEFYDTHTGFIPSSNDSINTPEALSYYDKLQEKYNREEIPDFWDSRNKGT